MDCRRIFNVACRSVSESIAPDAPLVAMMDDTLIRKRGRKVAGACTDPSLSLEHLVQFYAWCWEIELNFREEKTLLGAGEAQVRVPQAVACSPRL